MFLAVPIDAHDNLILCGPTGVDKSWLACAPGYQGLLEQPFSALPAHPQGVRGAGDGARRRPLCRIMRMLNGVQLLILDDWGVETLDARARRKDQHISRPGVL
jgi:DNA replication protein DnaC